MTNYKMRSIKAKDVFQASRILDKLDIDFKEIVETFNGKKDMTENQAGMAIFQLILSNVHKAEDEFNTFLGGLVGITADEFGELELDEMVAVLMQFKEVKGLDFLLKSLSK